MRWQNKFYTIDRSRKKLPFSHLFGKEKSGDGTALRNGPLQTNQNLAFGNKIISNMPKFFHVIVKIEFNAHQRDLELLFGKRKYTCLTNFSWIWTGVALSKKVVDRSSESKYFNQMPSKLVPSLFMFGRLKNNASDGVQHLTGHVSFPLKIAPWVKGAPSSCKPSFFW